jgi:hypothetical protein
MLEHLLYVLQAQDGRVAAIVSHINILFLREIVEETIQRLFDTRPVFERSVDVVLATQHTTENLAHQFSGFTYLVLVIGVLLELVAHVGKKNGRAIASWYGKCHGSVLGYLLSDLHWDAKDSAESLKKTVLLFIFGFNGFPPQPSARAGVTASDAARKYRKRILRSPILIY